MLAEIGRIVSSSLHIEEVYDRLGQEIRKLISFDRMVINTLDQGVGSVIQTWILGTEVPGRQQEGRVVLTGTFAEEVIRRRSPVMLDVDKEPDLQRRFPGLLPNIRVGIRSFLAAPLIFRDDVIGIIHLSSKEGGVYSQRILRTRAR